MIARLRGPNQFPTPPRVARCYAPAVPPRSSHPARRALALFALAHLSACASTDPRTAPEQHRAALLGLEARLAPEALVYADDPALDRPFAPAGVVVLTDTLWVWSADSPDAALLALSDAAQPPRRLSPAPPARRCLPGGGQLPALLYCAGPRVPGGLSVIPHLDAPALPSPLPPRGGYRDLALDPARGLIHLLDGVTDRLVTLDRHGATLAAAPAPPGATHLIALQSPDAASPHALAILSGPAPHLALQPLDTSGLPTAPYRPAPQPAPARDATYDPTRGLLWLVGPEPGPPRRADGPLRHLRSTLTALRPDTPDAAPAHRLDLGAHGLIDATAVAVLGRLIVIAATGSDAVAFVDPDPSPPTVTIVATGPAPTALTPHGDAVLVTHRADATIARAHPTAGLLATTRLRPPATDLRALGERLFYSAAIWQLPAADAVTCNTCHWDTGSDHRLQPGFLERRRELTRPLGGIGAVAPIFTTAGADSLAQAIEGLVRGLDDRFWQPAPHGSRYWTTPRTLPATPTTPARTIDAATLRTALLTFLATLPRPPGPLRVGPPPDLAQLSRGLALFTTHCASCHAPAADARRPTVGPPDLLAWLRTRGLAFTRPGWSRAGIAPSFHPQGHRAAPLVDLGRPGPFLSNASAATLGDVLDRLRPGTPTIHGGAPAEPATLPAADREALRTLLLWL